MISPTLVEGIFRTEKGNASDRPLNMEPMLVELDGERDPDLEMVIRRVLGAADGSGRVAQPNMKMEWRNLKRAPKTCKVTAVSNAGASTITVDDYALIHRDVLLQNTRTNELYLTALTSTKQVADAAAVPILSYDNAAGVTLYATKVGDVIQILCPVHAEGTTVNDGWTLQSENVYDYNMEIARRAADISNIADSESYYNVTPNARGLQSKYAMIELMEQINRLSYFGKSTLEIISASGARRWCMGGLRQKIVTNRVVMGAGQLFTPQVIGEGLRLTTWHTSASKRKIFMAGQNAILAMSGWPTNFILVGPGKTEWGSDVTRIITPYGDVEVVRDKTMSQEFAMADLATLIDARWVQSTFLQGNPMTVIQKASYYSHAHRIVDIVTTTCGMKLQNEENFGWWENIQG